MSEREAIERKIAGYRHMIEINQKEIKGFKILIEHWEKKLAAISQEKNINV